MNPWKQIKIFTADYQQSATIEPDESQTGIVLHSCEENVNHKSFALYMTKAEAIALGEELIKFAQSL